MKNLKIRYLTVSDCVRIARERGIVMGNVVMDSTALIKLCHSLDMNVKDVCKLVVIDG